MTSDAREEQLREYVDWLETKVARLEAENARLAGVLRRIEVAGDLGPHDGECAQIARAALAQDAQPVAAKEG